MGGSNACHYQEQHQQQYWHWKKQVKSHKEEYKETIFQQKASISLCMKWKEMNGRQWMKGILHDTSEVLRIKNHRNAIYEQPGLFD